MRTTILGMVLFVSFPVVAQEGVDSWVVDRTTDELRGTETVSAMIIKPKTIRSTGAMVRCLSGKLEAVVIFGDYLNNDARVPVRYRIDEGAIRTERWNVGTKGISVFANNPKQLADRLQKGNKFVIEAEDYQGTPHQESFKLAGSARAISQVYEACGID